MAIFLGYLLANPRKIANIALVLLIGAWLTGYLSNEAIAGMVNSLADRVEGLIAALDFDRLLRVVKHADSLQDILN